METLFVRDLMGLARGEVIEADFAIRDVEICPQKNGGSYLRLTLGDKTGTLGAKWFHCDETKAWQCQDIRYGKVCGKINDYKGRREIIVESIKDIGIPSDLSKFEAVAALPLNELNRRLEAHIASVRNPHLASLLGLIFGDGDLRRKFEECPAAMSRHHACRHGLLQHTLEVTDLAVTIAERQQTWGYERKVERDLVVAGALLHDIGKIRELTWGDGGNGFTRSGSLIGHVTQGALLVASKTCKIPEFPGLLCETLINIVSSHHGKLEWGAPVLPMTPEAQIIHMADLLDAQLFAMQEAEAKANTEFVTVKNLENRRMFVRSEPIAPINDMMKEAVPATGYQVVPQASRSAIPVLRFTTAGGSASAASFETRRLPLLGSVAAGLPLAAEQSIEEQFDVEAMGLPADSQTFLLRVRGGSMTGDGIADGDIVVVRPQEHHQPEDIVVALLRGENEAAIKRIEVRAEGVFLVSSNVAFAPIPVPQPEDLAIRGRVVARLCPREE